MFLVRETHSQLPKKANKCSVGAVQAFRIYGGIGMSASSLHRESTDSLIKCILCSYVVDWMCVYTYSNQHSMYMYIGHSEDNR